jgi:hypothetical protein
MAWIYNNLIGQGKQLCLYRMQQLLVAAAGQVSSSNRTEEKHIAPENKAVSDQHYMPGRMTRCLAHLECYVSDGQHIALL